MGALLIPIIVAIVVLVVLVVGIRQWGARREHLTTELADPATPTLDYRVPAGQDPSVVLSALDLEGFTATTDPVDTQLVTIHCPAGPDRDRARVRAVIGSVHTTGIDHGAPHEPGEVHFVDEQDSA
jgi:hypothetical protein